MFACTSLEDGVGVQPCIVRLGDEACVLVDGLQREDGLRCVVLVLTVRGEDECEVGLRAVSALQVDGHQQLDLACLRAVHRHDELVVALCDGHREGDGVVEFAGEFIRGSVLHLLREAAATLVDDVRELVEVGIDRPRCLEDDLIDLLEEARLGRLHTLHEAKLQELGVLLDPSRVHEHRPAFAQLAHLDHDEHLVEVLVEEVGVEDEVAPISAVNQLVVLSLGSLMLEHLEGVLDVGLEDGVVRGRRAVLEGPRLGDRAHRDVFEELLTVILAVEAEVADAELAADGDLLVELCLGAPGDAAEGIVRLLALEPADNHLAVLVGEAGLEVEVSGLGFCDGLTGSLALVTVSVEANDGVVLNRVVDDLRGDGCSVEDCVELLTGGLEVSYIAELEEGGLGGGGADLCHSFADLAVTAKSFFISAPVRRLCFDALLLP